MDIAYSVSEKGGALATVARACQIPLRTVESWIEKARNGTGSELHADFLRAIQDGRYRAEIRAIGIITGSGDPRDAQWWLTHNPTTRETWSDAAADRRAERKTVAATIEAIADSGLPPDLERRVLLNMQARGLSTMEPQEKSE